MTPLFSIDVIEHGTEFMWMVGEPVKHATSIVYVSFFKILSYPFFRVMFARVIFYMCHRLFPSDYEIDIAGNGSTVRIFSHGISDLGMLRSRMPIDDPQLTCVRVAVWCYQDISSPAGMSEIENIAELLLVPQFATRFEPIYIMDCISMPRTAAEPRSSWRRHHFHVP